MTTDERKNWIVMGKYTMDMRKQDVMGEGTSSICRKGTNISTEEAVAIKVYKNSNEGPKQEDVKLKKFKRQIAVLEELQEKFIIPKDPALWCETLEQVKPHRLFMSLIDYSKDGKGQPGLDPTDKILYVVTELAQYSLKDYLALRRDQNRPLPKESVRNMTKAIMLVVAGLHAKGFVHLDLKPENLMMFDGRLKLIDVDGCVRSGTSVWINDSSISFSPCYCAPEWATFLIEDSDSKIAVVPRLDVWSVGMTICELVTLDAILKPRYANFLRNGHSHRQAGFLFMEWLSSVRKVPLPKSIEKFPDEGFVDLLSECLLVANPAKRASLAQSLSHTYLSQARKSVSQMTPQNSRKSAPLIDMDEQVIRRPREKMAEDNTSLEVVMYKGTVWKLNRSGDVKDPASWYQRDMWIAGNGSLCYFSIKDNKRLVLFEGSKLANAQIELCPGGCKPHAFMVTTANDTEDGDFDKSVFACATSEELNEWMYRLKNASKMELMPKMRLGQGLAADLTTFRLNVKNKRMKVDSSKEDEYSPQFKAILWKVKAEGDRMKPEDWFEREMWIAKNGSLVYWSKKEERNLVYYTDDDIRKATLTRLDNSESFRPWAFQVQLPSAGGVEFAPGEFAAVSEELRNRWLAELESVK